MPSSACDWSSDVCSSDRSEEHTSELQSRSDLVCRLLLEKKKQTTELQYRSGIICRLLVGQSRQTVENTRERADHDEPDRDHTPASAVIQSRSCKQLGTT